MARKNATPAAVSLVLPLRMDAYPYRIIPSLAADAHQNQMNQVLSNKNVAANFGRVVFDLPVAQMKAEKVGEGPPSSQRRG